MLHDKTISIVIPCFNEAEGLRALLPNLPPSADEVIVVDNGSTDETAAVARAAGARVLTEPRRGYGRAYKTGFAAARGDVLVALDGDGTYHPYAIEYFVDILVEDGLSFISGRRLATDRFASPAAAARFLGGKLFGLMALASDFMYLRDILSGMWVCERAALAHLNVVADGFYFSQEIKLEAFRKRSARAAEIPLYFSYTSRRGQSKVRVLGHGLGGLAYFWRRRFRKTFGLWPRVPFSSWSEGGS